ncbi:MAG: MinD/ParA family protein [Candidatus Odinarchaeota archaeon]
MDARNDLEITMVHSYKGGVGKSTIAINLGMYLAVKMDRKVLLWEQDMQGPTYSEVFGISPIKHWNDFYSDIPLRDVIIDIADLGGDVVTGNLSVICAKKGPVKIPVGVTVHEFYTKHGIRMREQIRRDLKDFDHVILDTGQGITYEFANNLAASNTAVLAARLDPDAVNNTIDMYDEFYTQFENKRIVLVENQVPVDIDSYDFSQLMPRFSRAMTNWKNFRKDKDVVTIRLKESFAGDLFGCRYLDMDNPFIYSIGEICSKLFPELRA